MRIARARYPHRPVPRLCGGVAVSAEVRGLSLNQPWATLAALGVKQWETRSRALPKTITPNVDVFICSTVKAPRRHWEPTMTFADPTDPPWMLHPDLERFTDGWEASDGNWWCTEWRREWLGAVVAVVRFPESLPIYEHDQLCNVGLPTENQPHIDQQGDRLYECHWSPFPTSKWDDRDITDQLPYGDWRDGRHAWRIADVRPLAEPVSVRGDGVHHQGFWRPSAATVAAVREQVGANG